MKDSVERIQGYLTEYGKKYPRAWKQFNQFRDERGNKQPDWPDWCWCPQPLSYEVVNIQAPYDESFLESIIDASVLNALATWRITKGVYRFDTELFQVLWTTPLGELPVDVLYHFPEWCLYIDVPNSCTFANSNLYGFFTHLNWDTTRKRPQLRFLLDTDKGFIPYFFPLTSTSLDECVAEAFRQDSLQDTEEKKIFEPALDELVTFTRTNLAPILSVILYICSVSADITDLRGERDKPAKPKPKKSKKKERIPAAEKPTTWLVGNHIGPSLRLSGKSAPSSPGEGAHASPRPHVRRAHWHSYWTGSKSDPEQRKIVLKWIPPTIVGVGKIVPTIHEVK